VNRKRRPSMALSYELVFSTTKTTKLGRDFTPLCGLSGLCG
jgi:hypothetical protein